MYLLKTIISGFVSTRQYPLYKSISFFFFFYKKIVDFLGKVPISEQYEIIAYHFQLFPKYLTYEKIAIYKLIMFLRR